MNVSYPRVYSQLELEAGYKSVIIFQSQKRVVSKYMTNTYSVYTKKNV